MKDQDINKIEAHLKRTFGNPHINLRARPKQKDSAEVYMDQEFIGVIYEDEDEDGLIHVRDGDPGRRSGLIAAFIPGGGVAHPGWRPRIALAPRLHPAAAFGGDLIAIVGCGGLVKARPARLTVGVAAMSSVDPPLIAQDALGQPRFGLVAGTDADQ